jgi:hypothetical protein
VSQVGPKGVHSLTTRLLAQLGIRPGWLLAIWRPLVLGCALLLALQGQHLTDRRVSTSLALVVFTSAALFYAVAAPPVVRSRAAPYPTRLSFRSSYLFLALLSASLGFAFVGDNTFHWYGLIPYLLAIGLVWRAFPGVSTEIPWWRRATTSLQRGSWHISWANLGLLVAMLLGAALRLYRLRELPADLGWDLPYNYADTQHILHGQYLVFFPDNYGREGMFFYLAAAVSMLGRLSPYSLRLTSALVGVATIPALYLLAKECADRETGVYAALLLAASKWHMVLSRAGYRVCLMPLFAILALYGLARGLRRGQARDWAFAGLFLGLGIWTYKAFLFAIITTILCALFYALWPLRRRQQPLDEHSAIRWVGPPRVILAGLGIMIVVMMVVAVPMVRFAMDSPQVYAAREFLGLQLLGETAPEQHAPWWQGVVRNVRVSLLLFNYEGDGNSRFGVPYQRQFGITSAVLLVLGLAVALAHLPRGGNWFLVLGTLGLVMPMTASMLPGEAPNCFRSSGAIGPALTLAALALRNLREAVSNVLFHLEGQSLWLEVRGNEGKPCHAFTLPLHVSPIIPPLIVGVLFLAPEFHETTRFYFHDFAQVAPDVANYSVAQELAKEIIAFGEPAAFVKTWPYWYDGRAVNVFLDSAGHAPLQEIEVLATDKPPLTAFAGRILVLLSPEDTADLNTLNAFFPRSSVKTHHYPDGRPSFLAFYGEG